MDEMKLGLGDGMLKVTWAVVGSEEPGYVEIDIQDTMNQLIDWWKEWQGKPEIERGRALLAFVQSLGVPVTSVHAADMFQSDLHKRSEALKKKTEAAAVGSLPVSPASTASTPSQPT